MWIVESLGKVIAKTHCCSFGTQESDRMNVVLHCTASGAGDTLRCSDADEQVASCHGGSCVVMVVDGQREPSCRYVGVHGKCLIA